MGADTAQRLERNDAGFKRLRFQLRMSPLQRSALIGVLVEYSLGPDATEKWEECIHGETTTIGELLDLLATAQPEVSYKPDERQNRTIA